MTTRSPEWIANHLHALRNETQSWSDLTPEYDDHLLKTTGILEYPHFPSKI